MSSTFSCYQVAKSGIYVSQRALDVTGHNVSNADTTGYVRQQAIHTENCPMTYGKNQVGTGVCIGEVRQIRSIFLDTAYRKENSRLGYWAARQKTMEEVESILDEISSEDEGLGSAIKEFFQGWEEVAKDPQSRTARESVREYGNNFTDIVNQLAGQLDQIQADRDAQINAMIEEINGISDRVAALNEKILVNELNGQHANDYRDEANALLDTLSGYVDIEVSETDNGMLSVTAGGASLVNGTKAYRMTGETNASNGTFTTVVWEKTGAEVNVKSGGLLGLIESRGDVAGGKGSVENGSLIESGETEADVDGDSELYSFSPDTGNLISELKKGLNMLVSLVTRKINALHRSGSGLDGSTGVDFFVKIDENLPFEAGNIMINPDLDDPNKIAASATGEPGDASVAGRIADFSDAEYFQNDSLKMDIDDFYTMLVDWIGTTGQEAESFTDNQSVLLQQLQNKRESTSSVSMDEEMSNMIKYQHAYTASARVITTIDEMVDQIINRMGTVGR